jgi:hypothetical protein
MRSCGNPLTCSARRSDTPRNAAHELSRTLRKPRELVQIGAENAHGDVSRRPAKSLVDAHPEWRGEEDRDTGDVLQSVTHGVLDVVHRAASLIFEDDEHIGGGVRHRIFSRFRATRSSHDIVDLWNFTQEVFHAVIEPVDFFE